MSKSVRTLTLGIAALLAGTTSIARANEGLTEICEDCRPVRMATCGGFLEGATLDQAGSLWVVDVTGDRLLQIGATGQCVERAKTGGMPNGAKVGPGGEILIADRNGLFVFQPSTSSLSKVPLTFEGQPLSGLNDLALDGSGGVYFTVPGTSSAVQPSGRVFYVAKGESEAKLISDSIAFPNGVALGPNGETILVSEFAAKRILSIPSANPGTGFPLIFVHAMTRGGVGADGLARDEEGRLYAANLGSGEVLVYDASARPLGAIRLPLEGGLMVTNVVLASDAMFITEAAKGEVWRVPLRQRHSTSTP